MSLKPGDFMPRLVPSPLLDHAHNPLAGDHSDEQSQVSVLTLLRIQDHMVTFCLIHANRCIPVARVGPTRKRTVP